MIIAHFKIQATNNGFIDDHTEVLPDRQHLTARLLQIDANPVQVLINYSTHQIAPSELPRAHKT